MLPQVKDEIVGKSVNPGDEIEALDTKLKVMGVSPPGVAKIVYATSVNVVDPGVRLRAVNARKKGAPRCKLCERVEIELRCRVCREPICERHRVHCGSCGFYVCPDCMEPGARICVECAKKK